MTKGSGNGADLVNGDVDGESVPLQSKAELKAKEALGEAPKEKETISYEIDGEELEDDWGHEEETEVKSNCLGRGVLAIQRLLGASISKLKVLTRGYLTIAIFLVGYLAYFIAAMNYSFEDEGSHRLLGCTLVGILAATRHVIARTAKAAFVRIYGDDRLSLEHANRIHTVRFFLRWLCYGALLAVVVWILFDVGMKDPTSLRSIPGLLIFLIICLLFSSSPSRINWHTVYWSIGMQFVGAILVLKVKIGQDVLFWIQTRLNEYFDNTKPASILLFGVTYTDHAMVFQVLPLIIFLNSSLAALYYVGAMQLVIRVVGSFLSFVLDTQPVEAMSVAGGMFVEGVLAILSLKPYLAKQSKSQLFVVITSTLASLGGAYLAILASLGVSIHYIIPAMLISAPATFAVCKLMVPETRPKNSKFNQIDWEASQKGEHSNIMEAMEAGATSILTLLGNILAISYTLLAYISWSNNTIAWFGDRIGVSNFTLEYVFSYLLYPVALAMGIELKDCRSAATLLGYRLISSNIIAFFKLKEYRDNRNLFNNYMVSTNFTGPVSYDGDSVHLHLTNTMLLSGFVSERTEVIMTYSLCGFSSFLSVSIVLGTFYTLLPQRRKWLARMVIPALVAGNVANCMTGCFASFFY